MFGGIEAAPRHQRVGYAVGKRVLERYTEVKIIKFTDKAVLGTVTDFIGVISIILMGKLTCNVAERINKCVVRVYIVVNSGKLIEDGFSVFLPHFPKENGSGVV